MKCLHSIYYAKQEKEQSLKKKKKMERKNSSNSEKEKTASVIHGNRVWFFGDLVFLSE